MPQSLQVHKPQSLKRHSATLKQAQGIRTLALNGKAWRTLRALVLQQQPLCPECEAGGYLIFAREVDHIDNDASNNLRSNVQGLCSMHHSQKTRREAAENHRHSSATKRACPNTHAAAFRI